MRRLQNKRILLGVTGSIAAYKSADLVRRLRAAGAEVRVVMTRGATEFVAPLTFQALSGEPVHRDLLDADAEAAMGHIALARWADAILVAPASADFIARLAQGRADDLLTAVALASEVPLALAPSMNRQMWDNPATRHNVLRVAKHGVLLFGPASCEQACGEIGPGRMLEPEALLAALADLFETRSLTGHTVLLTAGPTREPIDPVRYLSNHSSGKMGYALATAAAEAGARVILVSGPVALDTPERVERHDVTTAEEMLAKVLSLLDQCDIFIGAAAVADYRPRTAAAQKLKKSEPSLTLELERTPDILAEVAARGSARFSVGFAAETDDLETHARAKLSAKRLDMIAANWVGPAAVDSAGTFGSDTNALKVYWHGGQAELPLEGKLKLARQLVAIIAERIQSARQLNDPKVVRLNERSNKN